METKVQAIPKGYNTLTPYINVKNAVEAIAFYKKSVWCKRGWTNNDAGRNYCAR